MPSIGAVCRWLTEEDKKPFLEQYTRAREVQADAIFEEMFEIADDGSNDWTKEDEGYRQNGEAIQRSRLRIDQRKWAIGRMAPKKYGDKLNVDATVKHEGALALLKDN